MKSMKVNALMVPLEEYATVSEDATLAEAIGELEKAQTAFDQDRYRHRAILVRERGGEKIIGKLSQLDVIRSLEPKYDLLGEKESLSHISLSRFGFSPKFMESMLEQYNLWQGSLSDICGKAAGKKVRDIMYRVKESECIKESANMSEAVHQLVMGHHQSLLVTRGDDIVGILRLTDIFREVSALLKECSL